MTNMTRLVKNLLTLAAVTILILSVWYPHLTSLGFGIWILTSIHLGEKEVGCQFDSVSQDALGRSNCPLKSQGGECINEWFDRALDSKG